MADNPMPTSPSPASPSRTWTCLDCDHVAESPVVRDLHADMYGHSWRANDPAPASPSVSPIAEAPEPALMAFVCPNDAKQKHTPVVVGGHLRCFTCEAPLAEYPYERRWYDTSLAQRSDDSGRDFDARMEGAGDVLTEEERALVDEMGAWANSDAVRGRPSQPTVRRLVAIIARLSGRESA